MKKKLLAALLVFIVTLAVGCQPAPAQPPAAEQAAPILGRIILSTTTSTYDSGLLDFILPEFTFQTGWEVDVIAVGTGAALQMGRDAQADVLLVHDRPGEDRFVADGYGSARYDVMFNDFIIVGPTGGPIAHTSNVEEAFRAILEGSVPFVSRGDDSGTHRMELGIWASMGVDPESNPEYISVGQGMGAALGMARELKAYTLSDRATWLNLPDKGNLEIVSEGDERLFNPYGIIPVSGALDDRINTEGAQAFADWMTSPAGQELIAVFGVEQFGSPLFFPDAR